jgi:hypothetical protein
MQSKVEFEVVLVSENKLVFDGKIFRVIAVDNRESTPLEACTKKR